MKKSLKSHFPMIRSKEEIRLIIRENLQLEELFQSWDMEQQKEFLEFCSGNQQIFSCASINVYGEKGEGRLAIGIFRKYIQLCFLKRVRKNCEKTK